MALTLYNPKTQTFAALTPPNADLPLVEVLLFNILIELQVQSQLIQDQNPMLLDTLEDARAGIVSNL